MFGDHLEEGRDLGGRLRIVSANLWNGRAHPEGFAQLIADLGADIVAAQEMTPAQADAIARVMPHGRLCPALDHSGMGIATRLPVETSVISLYMRSAPVIRLDPSDWTLLAKPLEVVNVHIYAPHVVRPKLGLPVRRRQIRDFERFFAEEGTDALRESRVLVGDFNATPIWPVYQWFARRFTDAAGAAAEQLGRPVQPTWGPWHRAPRLLRIDHGFVRGMEVEEFAVMPVPGSDHSAVVLDLRTD